jgi:hypothetical protein
MGTGSFPGVKRPGCGADHPPFLTTRPRPPSGLSSLLRGNFTFTNEAFHLSQINSSYLTLIIIIIIIIIKKNVHFIGGKFCPETCIEGTWGSRVIAILFL